MVIGGQGMGNSYMWLYDIIGTVCFSGNKLNMNLRTKLDSVLMDELKSDTRDK